VEGAESSGEGREVVADWSQDIATMDAVGLAPGTLYYFNVLVRDEAGNKSAYLSDSQEVAMQIIADHTVVGLYGSIPQFCSSGSMR